MKPRGPIPKPSPQRQAQPAQRHGGDVDASLSTVLSAWSGRSASTPVVQAKLQVGPVDDAFEREADAFASEAMRRMQSPSVQESSGPVAPVAPVAPAAPALHAAPTDTLQPARDPDQEKDTEESGTQPFLRPKLHFGGSSGGTDAPSDFTQRLGNMGSGGSLPAGLRRHLEGITGNPLGNVRIHTGAESHELNARIGAKAFTHGRDIYFGQGQYNPTTPAGQELIAHEVAHVGQQGREGVVRRKDQSHSEPIDYASAQSWNRLQWDELRLRDLDPFGSIGADPIHQPFEFANYTFAIQIELQSQGLLPSFFGGEFDESTFLALGSLARLMDGSAPSSEQSSNGDPMEAAYGRALRWRTEAAQYPPLRSRLRQHPMLQKIKEDPFFAFKRGDQDSAIGQISQALADLRGAKYAFSSDVFDTNMERDVAVLQSQTPGFPSYLIGVVDYRFLTQLDGLLAEYENNLRYLPDPEMIRKVEQLGALEPMFRLELKIQSMRKVLMSYAIDKWGIIGEGWVNDNAPYDEDLGGIEEMDDLEFHQEPSQGNLSVQFEEKDGFIVLDGSEAETYLWVADWGKAIETTNKLEATRKQMLKLLGSSPDHRKKIEGEFEDQIAPSLRRIGVGMKSENHQRNMEAEAKYKERRNKFGLGEIRNTFSRLKLLYQESDAQLYKTIGFELRRAFNQQSYDAITVLAQATTGSLANILEMEMPIEEKEALLRATLFLSNFKEKYAGFRHKVIPGNPYSESCVNLEKQAHHVLSDATRRNPILAYRGLKLRDRIVEYASLTDTEIDGMLQGVFNEIHKANARIELEGDDIWKLAPVQRKWKEVYGVDQGSYTDFLIQKEKDDELDDLWSTIASIGLGLLALASGPIGWAAFAGDLIYNAIDLVNEYQSVRNQRDAYDASIDAEHALSDTRPGYEWVVVGALTTFIDPDLIKVVSKPFRKGAQMAAPLADDGAEEMIGAMRRSIDSSTLESDAKEAAKQKLERIRPTIGLLSKVSGAKRRFRLATFMMSPAFEHAADFLQRLGPELAEDVLEHYAGVGFKRLSQLPLLAKVLDDTVCPENLKRMVLLSPALSEEVILDPQGLGRLIMDWEAFQVLDEVAGDFADHIEWRRMFLGAGQEAAPMLPMTKEFMAAPAAIQNQQLAEAAGIFPLIVWAMHGGAEVPKELREEITHLMEESFGSAAHSMENAGQILKERVEMVFAKHGDSATNARRAMHAGNTGGILDEGVAGPLEAIGIGTNMHASIGYFYGKTGAQDITQAFLRNPELSQSLIRVYGSESVAFATFIGGMDVSRAKTILKDVDEAHLQDILRYAAINPRILPEGYWPLLLLGIDSDTLLRLTPDRVLAIASQGPDYIASIKQLEFDALRKEADILLASPTVSSKLPDVESSSLRDLTYDGLGHAAGMTRTERKSLYSVRVLSMPELASPLAANRIVGESFTDPELGHLIMDHLSKGDHSALSKIGINVHAVEDFDPRRFEWGLGKYADRDEYFIIRGDHPTPSNPGAIDWTLNGNRYEMISHSHPSRSVGGELRLLVGTDLEFQKLILDPVNRAYLLPSPSDLERMMIEGMQSHIVETPYMYDFATRTLVNPLGKVASMPRVRINVKNPHVSGNFLNAGIAEFSAELEIVVDGMSTPIYKGPMYAVQSSGAQAVDIRPLNKVDRSAEAISELKRQSLDSADDLDVPKRTQAGKASTKKTKSTINTGAPNLPDRYISSKRNLGSVYAELDTETTDILKKLTKLEDWDKVKEALRFLDQIQIEKEINAAAMGRRITRDDHLIDRIIWNHNTLKPRELRDLLVAIAETADVENVAALIQDLGVRGVSGSKAKGASLVLEFVHEQKKADKAVSISLEVEKLGNGVRRIYDVNIGDQLYEFKYWGSHLIDEALESAKKQLKHDFLLLNNLEELKNHTWMIAKEAKGNRARIVKEFESIFDDKDFRKKLKQAEIDWKQAKEALTNAIEGGNFLRWF